MLLRLLGDELDLGIGVLLHHGSGQALKLLREAGSDDLSQPLANVVSEQDRLTTTGLRGCLRQGSSPSKAMTKCRYEAMPTPLGLVPHYQGWPAGARQVAPAVLPPMPHLRRVQRSHESHWGVRDGRGEAIGSSYLQCPTWSAATTTPEIGARDGRVGHVGHFA